MSTPVQTIPLDTAAVEIHQACDGLRPSQLPYFFLVGAGISKPPVKLAWEIIEDCRGVAGKYGRAAEPDARATPVDAYSHWFNQAYPHLVQRQRYLKELIRDKNISQANFRLAHLLLERRITNLVVTTNFDDFLLRALTLFGKQPIVCDHPRTVERIDAGEFDDIQLVHVHGTYWFYDCVNLKPEIDKRAQSSAQTTSTMAALLDNILSRRVPLVLGYSGWEGDVVMSALYRRLNEGRRLTHRLYWFCYRAAEVETLPEWLRRHEDVFFVVPRPPGEPPAAGPAQPGRPTPAPGADGLPADLADQPAPAEKGAESLLDARQVLDRLIQTFDLNSPALTSDPLRFFAEHLGRSLPADETVHGGDDIYLLKSVIERIERARQREEEEEAGELGLEKVRDALRRSQYREALREALTFNPHLLTAPQQQNLLSAIRAAAPPPREGDEEMVRVYGFAFELAELLSARGGADDPALREQAAWALVNKGYSLAVLNRREAALAAFAEAVAKFGDARELELREWVAKALLYQGRWLGAWGRKRAAAAAFRKVTSRYARATEPTLREAAARAFFNQGYWLDGQGNEAEAVAAYDEAARRFGDAPEPEIREWVAMALYNKGLRLRGPSRDAEAVAAYDEVVRRFGDAPETALRVQVAKALVSRGNRLDKMKGREAEALDSYEEVLRRYGGAAETELRMQVARALFNKGKQLGAMKRSEAAAAAFGEFVRQFGDTDDAELRELVARSLINRGAYLRLLGNAEEASAAFGEVVRRFGGAVEPGLRAQVARALNSLGLDSLRQAKRALRDGNEADARATLREAAGKMAQALEYDPRNWAAQGGRAYVTFLLGEKDLARRFLAEGLAAAGEKVRQAALDEAGTHTLPQDEEFRELVRPAPQREKH